VGRGRWVARACVAGWRLFSLDRGLWCRVRVGATSPALLLKQGPGTSFTTAASQASRLPPGSGRAGERPARRARNAAVAAAAPANPISALVSRIPVVREPLRGDRVRGAPQRHDRDHDPDHRDDDQDVPGFADRAPPVVHRRCRALIGELPLPRARRAHARQRQRQRRRQRRRHGAAVGPRRRPVAPHRERPSQRGWGRLRSRSTGARSRAPAKNSREWRLIVRRTLGTFPWLRAKRGSAPAQDWGRFPGRPAPYRIATLPGRESLSITARAPRPSSSPICGQR